MTKKIISATKIGEAVRITENIQQRPISSRRRTGRAFFIDTFEHYTAAITEKWIQEDGTISLATDYPKSGLNCMKLVTGAVATNEAMATLRMGAFPKGRFGIEFEFQNGDTVTNVTEIDIFIQYRDGVNDNDASIRYLAEANLKWQYKTSTASWADVPSGAQTLDFIAANQPTYHNVKFVVDFATKKYVKLFINEKEFDLSTLALYSTPNVVPPILKVMIMIKTAAAAAATLRVDNVILTDQET